MRDTWDGSRPQTSGFRLNGHHVLWMLIAFFGIVFLVNGVFLARALSTYTGVVSVEPYRKGLAYNERIEAAERQFTLGWSADVRFASPDALEAKISDRDGRPVTGLSITGRIGRPSTASADLDVRLTEEGPGRYVARTTGLQAGTWLVTLAAHSDISANGEPAYRSKRRLWLKP